MNSQCDPFFCTSADQMSRTLYFSTGLFALYLLLQRNFHFYWDRVQRVKVANSAHEEKNATVAAIIKNLL